MTPRIFENGDKVRHRRTGIVGIVEGYFNKSAILLVMGDVETRFYWLETEIELIMEIEGFEV